jgi:predicted nucleotidyltransferase
MKSIIEKITDIFKQYPEIVFAILFGSFVKNDPNPADVDVAVYIDNYKGVLEEIGLRNALENKLGEVLPLKADVKVINNAPIEILLEIIETGALAYARDKNEYSDYLENLSREALDTIQNRISLKEAENEILCL